MKWRVLMVIAGVCASSQSIAQAPTAASLLEICSRTGSALSTCNIYLKGFVGGSQVTSILRNDGHTICFPEGVTGDQLREVVLAFLRKHPEVAARGGDAMAGVALWQAYPCKDSK